MRRNVINYIVKSESFRRSLRAAGIKTADLQKIFPEREPFPPACVKEFGAAERAAAR